MNSKTLRTSGIIIIGDEILSGRTQELNSRYLAQRLLSIGISVKEVNLSDLFLLFIYAEVLGMVATFYTNNRIPVTLPLIIAMTALTRMIIQESKDLNAINIIYEATGILILAISAYIMTLKDKISLKKLLLREKIDESDIPD